ncbi:MAG TPA: DUF421 domain-containing protein [Dermatophilaceae bacterium]|jgi:uncharacterized membrane protein YcaP (DUF421 family)|nr:DUF421 domain-containing protein [Dermatophilaceae bacterium]
MELLWAHVGITWWGVLGVILATLVLYLVYAGALKVFGPRLSASTSTLSIAVLAVLSAIAGRSMLGDSPTLLGGLTAIATLLALEAVMGRLRLAARTLRRGDRTAVRKQPVRRQRARRPTVALVNGRIHDDALAGLGLSREQFLGQLRQAGVHHLADAGLVIVEGREGLTVIRVGHTIDEVLIEGVVGADLVSATLIRR